MQNIHINLEGHQKSIAEFSYNIINTNIVINNCGIKYHKNVKRRVDSIYVVALDYPSSQPLSNTPFLCNGTGCPEVYSIGLIQKIACVGHTPIHAPSDMHLSG
jgi:hypothetical protein